MRLIENYDITKVKDLLCLLEIDGIINVLHTDNKDNAKNHIKEINGFLNHIKTNNVLEVEYINKGNKTNRNYCDGYSIQGISGKIKGYLFNGTHTDIDQANSFFTILLYVCNKHNISCDLIREYVGNRQNILKVYNLTKHDILAVLFGNNQDKTTPYIINFRTEIKNITKQLLEVEEYKHYLEISNKEHKQRVINNDFYDRNNTFMTLILSHYEYKISNLMIEFCKKNDVLVSVYMYDGIIVEGEHNEEFLNKMNMYVNDKIDGLNCILTYKAFNTEIQEYINSPEFIKNELLNINFRTIYNKLQLLHKTYNNISGINIIKNSGVAVLDNTIETHNYKNYFEYSNYIHNEHLNEHELSYKLKHKVEDLKWCETDAQFYTCNKLTHLWTKYNGNGGDKLHILSERIREMIEYSHLLRVEINKKDINAINEEIEDLEATTTTDIKSKRELKKQITQLKQEIIKIQDTEEKLTAKQKKTYINQQYINNLFNYLKSHIGDNNFSIKLNKIPKHFVFRNGIYDIENKSFRYGIKPNDFLSKSLDYDWREMGDLSKYKILIKDFILKIANDNEEHYKYLMTLLGYSLLGIPQHEKHFNIWNGKLGDNGKTKLIEILGVILPIYIKSIDGKYLTDEGGDKIHKGLKEVEDARIVYAEEVPNKPINAKAVKQIADGTNIDVEILYGTSSVMTTTFKLFITLNRIPQLKAKNETEIDGGLFTRLNCFSFVNRFVETSAIEHEQKRTLVGKVYPRNVEFIDLFKQDEYKFSLLEMLIEAGSEYINYYTKTKESYLSLLLPNEFKTFKKNILDINNPLADFINDTYDITSDKTDKISKEEIFDAIQATEDTDLIKDFHNKIKLEFQYYIKWG